MKCRWLVVLLIGCLTATAQHSSRVKELERQRKRALEEIETTNRLLAETERTAQSSLNRLNLLSQQVLARQQVVRLLNEEIAAIDGDMRKMNGEIAALGRDLKEKQAKYAKSVQGLYKRRTAQDRLLFILSAENFAQSLRRMRYLREYAGWQERQGRAIVEKRREIALRQAAIEATRKEKQALLADREKEASRLRAEESAQQAEVQQLKKKQRELQTVLADKKRQAETLNRQIEKQIAEEIARAEALARAEQKKAAGRKKDAAGKEAPAAGAEAGDRQAAVRGGYAMTTAERKLSADFAGNRGRLPAPVNGRYTLVGRFGEQQHQELKNVRLNNNGIDLQASPGTDARAVFDGVVTRVFVVPGYNNSIIVRHGNYLTVYANLSQVYVKAGDKVSVRQPLGRIYTDTEDGNATLLHFQLWKEKTKLDPLPWLK